ncbi:aryl-sulfate sulfotransferase [uncultured Albimonas sp.]|uniref:aryl-sulfate sulfotransferase n=1 Tax=uncultured Albimonas sp. TaxID=1331701 RepID=UPI0030EF73DA
MTRTLPITQVASGAAPDQVTFRRRLTGLTCNDPARSFGGLTLYAPQTAGGLAKLIDEEGREVHRWTLPVRPGRHAVLLGNGNLGYNGSCQEGPILYPIWPLWRGGDFMEVAPDGEIVRRHVDPAHHHDAQWLANGDILYTAAHPLPEDTVRRLGGAPGARVYGDVVRQVNRDGETVWEWRSWEHLRPEDFPTQPVFDLQHWPMINGLWDAREGLVLMSLRTTSGVIAVRRDTGAVAWVIGQDVLAQQHTPVELETGNVLVFDNGTMRPGVSSHFSRVIEVDPATNAIVWEYRDPNAPSFFSPYMGGAQRLANGNTFITESSTGRLFEVTPEGEVVWEFVIPEFGPYPEPGMDRMIGGHHNSVFRAYRYDRKDVPWL